MDRRGAAPVVLAGIALAIAAWLVLSLGFWWLAALVAGAIVFDCGLRTVMVPNQTLMNSLLPQARSRANTIFGVSVWGGNAAGALVMTLAFARGGWLAVCAIALAASVAALAVQRWLPAGVSGAPRESG
jgi:predicted MFS family arabinose efflux permease